MATRKETTQRRLSLNESLRSACLEGQLQPGEMLPPVRELAQQYSVSMKVVCEAVAVLVGEGVLYTVPRVGTFVGRPPAATSEPYLFVSYLPKLPTGFAELLRIGFEERIAQLGGACLSMDIKEALWYLEQGALPPLSGVFEVGLSELGRTLASAGVPCVVFDDPGAGSPLVDRINFDNLEAGIQATKHLLNLGHRQIAFMALHDEQTAQQLDWSMLREQGWRSAISQAKRETAELAFHPAGPIGMEQKHGEDHRQAGRDMAPAIIARPDITAVVAANVHAANGFMEVLRDSNIPTRHWPAIICFDNAPTGGASVVSYLRLPWEKVGSEAAQLLWERKTGRLSGPPQQQLVAMQLIPRLSCRLDWASTSRLAQNPAAVAAA